MPLYTSMTQEGTLSQDQRFRLAKEITRVHVTATGVPSDAVHVVFATYPHGAGFIGEQQAPTSSLVAVIREGHSVETKQSILQQLWPLYRQATGLRDGDLVLTIQEVPATQAMEQGRIMNSPS